MFVMRMEDLLALSHLETHERCQQRELLVLATPNSSVFFISHQWLGWSHPDPQDVQLRRLQAVLRSVVGGAVSELFEPDDWSAFATGVDKRKNVSQAHAEALQASQVQLTASSYAQEARTASVWMDYFSVPQTRNTLDVAKGGVAGKAPQLLAIKSIPYYIERATYFFVIAPEATHVDTGEECGLDSWRSRGWCRLEEQANFLSMQAMNPVIVTSRAKLAVEEFADFWSFCANSKLGGVGVANFTCEQDRAVCVEILRRMWAAKLQLLQEKGQRMLLTLFGVLASKLFATEVRALRLTAGHSAREGWSEALVDWRLGTLGAEGHPIGAPIVAAMLGDAELLREAFASGLDVGQRHKATGATTLMHCAGSGDCAAVRACIEVADAAGVPLLDVGTTKLNISPLDRAIRCGHADVTQVLLEAKASTMTRRSNGDTLLHAAAEMGRLECAQLLLAARADVHAANEEQQTPLRLATTDFTLFGSQRGKREVAKLLLAHGADPRDTPDALAAGALSTKLSL